jgi:hypothetical protein
VTVEARRVSEGLVRDCVKTLANASGYHWHAVHVVTATTVFTARSLSGRD